MDPSTLRSGGGPAFTLVLPKRFMVSFLILLVIKTSWMITG